MKNKRKSKQRLVIGIDIGGTNVYSILITETGRIKGERHFPTLAEKGPEAVIKNIAKNVRLMVSDSGYKMKDVWRAGVGSPGPLNSKKGIIMGAVNLKGWKHVELKKRLESLLKVKVGVDNDANCAVYGENWLGAAKKGKNIVGFTLGTGVGGGIIIEGRMVRGANFNAAEIGHMSIVPGGRLCNCGIKGCLEQYASASAIAKSAKEKIKKGRRSIILKLAGGKMNNITSKTVYSALVKNDKLAKEVWNEFIDHLGYGIANIINALNPDTVVIAGGVINAGNRLFTPLKKAVKKQSFGKLFYDCKILPAKLGERAGAIGAAGVVIAEGDYYNL